MIMLWFLTRNRERLTAHVTKARYGLFFSAYRHERFYWEIILLARKIIIVALSLFGPVLGTLRQAEVVLLVLLICIMLEIVGAPYRETTARHKVLAKLEVGCLCVEWVTMWSGIMMFSSLDLPDHETTVVFFTLLVVLVNALMMACLVFSLVRECFHENKNKPLILKIQSKASSLNMRGSFSFRRKTSEHQNGEEAGTDSESVGIEMRHWARPNPVFGQEAAP